MVAYYNENDPYCAEWLTNLVLAGYLPDGEVDTRSIVDVRPSDLLGFTQCHFFAGIGGWPLALARSGWPADRPVWTGSCPCQPFSIAGHGAGTADARHLWPAWYALIQQSKPPELFGEQVASKDGVEWLDTVCSEMEAGGYAIGTALLTAAGSGAPHVRKRLWFYAYPHRDGVEGLRPPLGSGPLKPWGSFSEVDLRQLLESPYQAGERCPQPLLCAADDGFSSRMGRLHSYGNAIQIDTAIDFIQTCMEYESL